MSLRVLILVIPVLASALSTGSIGQSETHLPDLPQVISDELTHAPLARTQSDIAIQSWVELLNRGPVWAETWASRLQTRLDRVYQNNNTRISAECRHSLSQTIDGVRKMEDWALKREFSDQLFSFSLFSCI